MSESGLGVNSTMGSSSMLGTSSVLQDRLVFDGEVMTSQPQITSSSSSAMPSIGHSSLSDPSQLQQQQQNNLYLGILPSENANNAPMIPPLTTPLNTSLATPMTTPPREYIRADSLNQNFTGGCLASLTEVARNEVKCEPIVESSRPGCITTPSAVCSSSASVPLQPQHLGQMYPGLYTGPNSVPNL